MTRTLTIHVSEEEVKFVTWVLKKFNVEIEESGTPKFTEKNSKNSRKK